MVKIDYKDSQTLTNVRLPVFHMFRNCTSVPSLGHRISIVIIHHWVDFIPQYTRPDMGRITLLTYRIIHVCFVRVQASNV